MEELGRLAPAAATPVPAEAGTERVWPEAAFAAIFEQHYARVVAVAARCTGDWGAAEEIADDTFWKLYLRPQLAGEGQCVGAWLYRTASRAGVDALRARRRRGAVQDRLAAEPTHTAASPLQQAEQRQTAERVRHTLARLDRSQACLLLLRHSGLSYAEVAAALRLNPSSIGTLLRRAQDAFARAYREIHHAG